MYHFSAVLILVIMGIFLTLSLVYVTPNGPISGAFCALTFVGYGYLFYDLKK